MKLNLNQIYSISIQIIKLTMMDELELQKVYQNGVKANASRPASDLKLREQ